MTAFFSLDSELGMAINGCLKFLVLWGGARKKTVTWHAKSLPTSHPLQAHDRHLILCRLHGRGALIYGLRPSQGGGDMVGFYEWFLSWKLADVADYLGDSFHRCLLTWQSFSTSFCNGHSREIPTNMAWHFAKIYSMKPDDVCHFVKYLFC